MIKPSATALQVVVGTEADQVAGEMKIALRASRAAPAPATQAMNATATTASSTPPHASSTAAANSTRATSAPDASSPAPDAAPPPDAAAPPIPTPTLSSLLSALGGRSNILAIETASTRLRINIADPKVVNESAIAALGLRGVAHAAPNWLHVIVGPRAATAGVTLRQLL